MSSPPSYRHCGYHLQNKASSSYYKLTFYHLCSSWVSPPLSHRRTCGAYLLHQRNIKYTLRRTHVHMYVHTHLLLLQRQLLCPYWGPLPAAEWHHRLPPFPRHVLAQSCLPWPWLQPRAHVALEDYQMSLHTNIRILYMCKPGKHPANTWQIPGKQQAEHWVEACWSTLLTVRELREINWQALIGELDGTLCIAAHVPFYRTYVRPQKLNGSPV